MTAQMCVRIIAALVLLSLLITDVQSCNPSLVFTGLSNSIDTMCIYYYDQNVTITISISDENCGGSTIFRTDWQIYKLGSSTSFEFVQSNILKESIRSGEPYVENFDANIMAAVISVNFTVAGQNYSEIVTGYCSTTCIDGETLMRRFTKQNSCRGVIYHLRGLGHEDPFSLPACLSTSTSFPFNISKVQDQVIRPAVDIVEEQEQVVIIQVEDIEEEQLVMNRLPVEVQDQALIPHNITISCIRNCQFGSTSAIKEVWLTVECLDCVSEMVASTWRTAKCASANAGSCGSMETHTDSGVTPQLVLGYMPTQEAGEVVYHAAFLTVTFADESKSNATFFWMYEVDEMTVGNCTVNPATGYALDTFNITCTGFLTTASSLTYKIHTNREESYNNALLLYNGPSPDLKDVRLGQGQESTNYTVYILLKACTPSGTEVSLVTTAQVLPLEMKSSESDILTVVGDLLDVGNTGNGSEFDRMLNEGNQEGAVQLLGMISSTLNAKSETGDVSYNSTQQSQMRTAIVDNMDKVTIDSYSVVDLMVSVLNSAVQQPDELTEGTQDKARDVYGNLANKLGELEFSGDEVRDTAGSLMVGVSSILDVTSDQASTEIAHDDNVTDVSQSDNKEKVKNSTSKLLSTLDTVLSTLLSWQLPGEPPAIVQSETMSVSVRRVPTSDLLGKTVFTPGGVGGGMSASSLKIPASFDNINGSNIGVKLMQLQKNPYTWDSSARDVTLDVLSVELELDGSPLVNASLQEPVIISIPISDQFEASERDLSVHLLKSASSNLTFNTAFSNLLTFNFSIQLERTTLLAILPAVTNFTRFRMLISMNGTPTLDDVLNFGFVFPDDLHLQSNFTSSPPDAEEPLIFLEQTVNTTDSHFVGLTVDLQHPDTIMVLQQTHNECLADAGGPCSLSITIPLRIETRSLACLYWDVDKEVWSDYGCEVSSNSSRSQLLCACSHLTTFSGSVLVLPNFVDPVADAALFLTFFDNPVVVTVVIMVWVTYFFLIHWARRADRNDQEKLGVVNCTGNDVSHRQRYLICVVTGWRGEAGTTANVCLYMKGTHGSSLRRRLGTSSRKCFQTGYEDWFLLTYENFLGELREITVWHDNAGTSPHWYLSHVYVKDLETNLSWTFIYNDWLAVDRGSVQMTSATLRAISEKELSSQARHNFLARSSHDLRDGHLWVSVFSKPPRSTFTRAQRLTCALSLLLLTMLTNIMFYGVSTEDPEDQLGVAGSVISVSAIVIGIESSLLMFPLNLIILQLFLKVKSRSVSAEDKVILEFDDHGPSTVRSDNPGRLIFKQLLKMLDIPIQPDATEGMDGADACMSWGSSSPSRSKVVLAAESKNTGKILPWWFVYIAWMLVLTACLVSSFFVMLYGLKYGYTRSLQWLVSFLTGFTQSAFITQPIKVFGIALVLTWIFKKTLDTGDFGPDIYIDEDDELMKNISGHPDIHVPYNAPLSARVLQSIRDRLKLEWLMNITIRDILLYLIYLVVVMVVTHGHRNIRQAYYNTLALEDIFVNPGCINPSHCFFLEKADKPENVIKYLEEVLVPSLADMSIPDHTHATPGSSHFLVGPYRLRQQRVTQGSCDRDIHNRLGLLFNNELHPCVADYWMSREDTKDYNGSWKHVLQEAGFPTSHWTHQSSWQLLTVPFSGKFATYSAGGYVVTMPTDVQAQLDTVSALWNSDWLDGRTRALFVEFTLFNPNVNIFSVVTIIFEQTNHGAVFPGHEVFSAQLYRASSDFDRFVTTCECLFLIFNIGYIYIEYKRYKTLGRKEYFKDFWNWMEILQISLATSIVGLYFKRMLTVDEVIKQYQENGGQRFVSFYAALTWDFILGYVMAFLVALVTFKFIKLLRFNKNIFRVADTLAHSKKSVISFMVMVIVFGLAFSHFTLIAFGTTMYSYRDMICSLLTVFNFSLGVSDLPGLQETNRVLGPVYFVVFVLVVQFCFLTIFAAILNFGINDAKELFLERKNKFELLDYIQKKVREILRL